MASNASAQFTTVINLPPTPYIGSFTTLGSNTQVNLADGGAIRGNVDAGAFDGSSVNIEVNIAGGTVNSSFSAYDGSTVNISGGVIDRFMSASGNSVVNMTGGSIGEKSSADRGSSFNMSGGTIGRDFRVNSGAIFRLSGGTVLPGLSVAGGVLEMIGNDFLLDGASVPALADVGDAVSLNIPSGSLLSGYLADGTLAVLGTGTDWSVGPGGLRLKLAELPPLSSDVIAASTDPLPRSVRGGQTLVVDPGGTVPHYFGVGAGGTMQVMGGQAGNYLRAIQATIDVSSGSIGANFRADALSVVNVSGGTIGSNFLIDKASANISGGSVRDLQARDAAQVIVTGGGVGPLTASSNSRVEIRGGSVETLTSSAATTTMSGGTMKRSVSLALSSTLDVSGGLLSGRVKVIEGSLLRVSGGTFEDAIDLDTATARVTGGSVNDYINARKSSQVVVDGGYVYTVNADAGARSTITGGAVGHLTGQGFASITGGTIGSLFAGAGGVEISGGSIGSVRAQGPGQLHLRGGEFRLDGVPIASLSNPGDTLPVSIPEGSLLTGVFSDGTPLVLSSDRHDAIADGALRLTVTTLPAVGSPTLSASTDEVPLGLRTGQTLIVDAGGQAPAAMKAERGSTIHVTGGDVGGGLELIGATMVVSAGSVGGGVRAHRGSTITIEGGRVEEMRSYAGTTVNLRGGGLGGLLAWDQFNIFGGEFFLGGQPIDMSGASSAGRTIVVPDHTLLSGVLADGTPFAGTGWGFFPEATVTLFAEPLPAIDPPVIYASTTPTVRGIRTGQRLIVDSGGAVTEDFIAGRGSKIEVLDGSVGSNLKSVHAEIAILGGAVGDNLLAVDNSTVRIEGGLIGAYFYAENSQVAMSGGVVDERMAFEDSSVSIAGGSIGDDMTLFSSVAIISGGSIGARIGVNASQLYLRGTEFAINGVALRPMLEFNVPFTITQRNAVLTARLADGTPFDFTLNGAFTNYGDYLDSTSTLTVLLVPEPSTWALPGIGCVCAGSRRRRQ